MVVRKLHRTPLMSLNRYLWHLGSLRLFNDHNHHLATQLTFLSNIAKNLNLLATVLSGFTHLCTTLPTIELRFIALSYKIFFIKNIFLGLIKTCKRTRIFSVYHYNAMCMERVVSSVLHSEYYDRTKTRAVNRLSCVLLKIPSFSKVSNLSVFLRCYVDISQICLPVLEIRQWKDMVSHF